jgi:hypothetical protein
MIAHKLERARAIQDDLARLMAEIADEVDALRREDAMEDELAA